MSAHDQTKRANIRAAIQTKGQEEYARDYFETHGRTPSPWWGVDKGAREFQTVTHFEHIEWDADARETLDDVKASRDILMSWIIALTMAVLLLAATIIFLLAIVDDP